MEARLDGRIAQVTGAAQGSALPRRDTGEVGRCRPPAYRSHAERGRAVQDELVAQGVAAHFVPADLADAAATSSLVALAWNASAASTVSSTPPASPTALRSRMGRSTTGPALFDVNTRAPFLLMQGAVRAMRESGGGSIVNILSINTHCGAPDLAIYSASKAALAVLTKNAAHAHRFDRIRINGINVGWADTTGERQMQSQILGLGEGWLDEANAAQPFGRLLARRTSRTLPSSCSAMRQDR